VQKTATLRRAS